MFQCPNGLIFWLILHNAWEGVRKRLEAYAYNDLARFEPLQGGNAFIDEEGKVIKCIKEPLK